MRLPSDRHPAFLDRLRLFALVALDRCLNKRRIDDLTTACQITVRQQLLLYPVGQRGARAGLSKAVAEQPNRRGGGGSCCFG